ncbi:DUF262 domain-containing protein [Terrisporobacter vanillatitrophus]|uniref:DUF262 domain-containing protein n=1 Tax=Terrisporobacter vanillatitrophus TaxID=3058402 RepID=UPI003368D32E
MTKINNLRDEIIAKRGEIYTNQMTMSVGELISLYNDKEINLEPAFQRVFRWSEEQETNFIESILLGYPIPSIFVLQREDGIWDVIDGVQRLSTIYHFVGILIDSETSELEKPLQLKKAKILTYLENKFFNSNNKEESLDSASRIDFKRSIIPVILIKHNSEERSKFELFKRLNTGGSHLSKQEIRNALILMSNDDVYNKLSDYCERDYYQEFLNLSDTKSETRMDMDILTRFLVMRNYKNIESVRNSEDINEFMDNAICDIISDKSYSVDHDISTFDTLIKFLSTNISDDYGFKVYNQNEEKYKGGFNWVAFETIAWGLTVINDLSILDNYTKEIVDTIKSIKGTGEFIRSKGKSNVKVIERLKLAKEEAERLFNYSELH